MMLSIRFKLIVIVFSTLFIVISCKNKTIYHDKMMIDEKGWLWAESYKTNANIKDNIGSYNLYIDIEFSNEYAFSNMYLFVSTILPNDEVLKDTINCVLADGSGKWYGKTRFGKVINQLPYKLNVRFPFKGNYNFEIEQAMRIEPLENVNSCGITIEKNH